MPVALVQMVVVLVAAAVAIVLVVVDVVFRAWTMRSVRLMPQVSTISLREYTTTATGHTRVQEGGRENKS